MKPSTQAAPLASGSGVDLHIQGTGIDVRMHGLHGLGTYRGEGGGGHEVIPGRREMHQQPPCAPSAEPEVWGLPAS